MTIYMEGVTMAIPTTQKQPELNTGCELIIIIIMIMKSGTGRRLCALTDIWSHPSISQNRSLNFALPPPSFPSDADLFCCPHLAIISLLFATLKNIVFQLCTPHRREEPEHGWKNIAALNLSRIKCSSWIMAHGDIYIFIYYNWNQRQDAWASGEMHISAFTLAKWMNLPWIGIRD